jgi:glycosyltransferase involved in cell wall biosynthesis
MNKRRMLLVLPQFPLDPTSGAAQSMATMAEFAAAGGWLVRALATTAIEASGLSFDTLRSYFPVESHRNLSAVHESGFQMRGVDYRLLRVAEFNGWQAADFSQFDEMFNEELREFRPSIVLTYGGSQKDHMRRYRAQVAGAKVVFGLRNLAYVTPQALEFTDAILTPSHFVRRYYEQGYKIKSTVLPLPVFQEDFAEPQCRRSFITFINPSPEKGVCAFARIAEEISKENRNAPILVVESRGKFADVVTMGLAGGFDLRDRPNIVGLKTTLEMWKVYRHTRLLLVPSVWQEPAGRVAVEAILNGIPVIASDRGGLPETLAGGGYVLPLPDSATPESAEPCEADEVRAWTDLTLELMENQKRYELACTSARLSAQCKYDPEQVKKQYIDFFNRVELDA